MPYRGWVLGGRNPGSMMTGVCHGGMGSLSDDIQVWNLATNRGCCMGSSFVWAALHGRELLEGWPEAFFNFSESEDGFTAGFFPSASEYL